MRDLTESTDHVPGVPTVPRDVPSRHPTAGERAMERGHGRAYIVWFDEYQGNRSRPRVGGKNASLGTMMSRGLPVPPGFAVTTDAYESCGATRAWGEVNGAARSGAPRRFARLLQKVVGRGAQGDRADPLPGRDRRPHPPGLRGDLCRHDAASTPCRWRCDRRRPPRTCPTPASPASRTPSCGSQACDAVLEHMRALLVVDLHRPGDQLPPEDAATTTR
jgi:hypothetical protein